MLAPAHAIRLCVDPFQHESVVVRNGSTDRCSSLGWTDRPFQETPPMLPPGPCLVSCCACCAHFRRGEQAERSVFGLRDLHEDRGKTKGKHEDVL